MLNIVLFGAPGAGKGTQAAILAGEHDLVHLSTGDILRKEIASGTELGKQAQGFIDKGEFVPDRVVIDIIRSQIEQHPDAKGFIFDGFPRTTAQAETLDRLMTEKGMQIASMVALDVETGELVKRLLKRGASSGRADDRSLDVIRNRIDVYHRKTEPIIGYYHTQKKYHPIDGTGDIADISDRLRRHVKGL
ncbi:MAG: adenylate kinase [Bacteroidales bacterium]|jgi:adenylate kinase|nr:adenylate kinase [Bacteroidales bacterium]